MGCRSGWLLAALAAISVAGAAGEAAAQDSTKAGRSTKDGVYTPAQADRGEMVFKATCLECHVPEDYQADAFKSKFVGGTVFDMWDLIRSSMPQNNPGSLTKEQYTDVVAYLFKLNVLPTGNDELPAIADSLKKIKVEAKDPALNFTFLSKGKNPHHGSSRIR